MRARICTFCSITRNEWISAIATAIRWCTGRTRPPHEDVSDEYLYHLITGRTIYHFHTRTKTARAPELESAPPAVWPNSTNRMPPTLA